MAPESYWETGACGCGSDDPYTECPCAGDPEAVYRDAHDGFYGEPEPHTTPASRPQMLAVWGLAFLGCLAFWAAMAWYVAPWIAREVA